MIKLVTAFVLTIISFSVMPVVDETRKGYWVPVCGGVEISRHTRYGKAYTAVMNHGSDCDIVPPIFEITFTPEPQLNDVLVTWTKPTRNEDENAIKTIDRFNLYYTLDGGVQNVVEVEADSASFILADLSPGSYSIYMSTVSNGVEGKPSAPIIKIVE